MIKARSNLTSASSQAFEFSLDLLLTGEQISIPPCVLFDLSELAVYILKNLVDIIDFLFVSSL